MTWMRRLLVVAGVAGALALGAWTGPAGAATSAPEGYVPADCADAPATAQPEGFGGQQSGPVERQCLRSRDGMSWSIVEEPADDGDGAGMVLGIFLVALVWMAVPVGIAIYMARRHDEHPGLAVILTLLLGWVGLLIVVYGQRRTAQALHDLAGPRTARPEDAGTR